MTVHSSGVVNVMMDVMVVAILKEKCGWSCNVVCDISIHIAERNSLN